MQLDLENLGLADRFYSSRVTGWQEDRISVCQPACFFSIGHFNVAT
jgi:hypothetical protein